MKLTPRQRDNLAFLAKAGGPRRIHRKVGSSLTLKGLVIKHTNWMSDYTYCFTYSITEAGKQALQEASDAR